MLDVNAALELGVMGIITLRLAQHDCIAKFQHMGSQCLNLRYPANIRCEIEIRGVFK